MTSRRRSWGLRLLLVGGSLLAGLLLCEGTLRVYQRVALGVPLGNQGLWAAERPTPSPPASLPNLFDRRLGWRPTEGYRFEGTGQRADGSSYPLRVSQGHHGFRRFGSGTGPRTLVVGDSYTQALQVSDDRTYYALLEHEVGLRTYAVGSSGYGTLQELLLAEEEIGEVKPELVLWQYCYNDFMDNSFELESAWRAGNGQLHERPYLFGEDIQFRLPGAFERVRTWASRSTRLYEFVAGRLARLRGPAPAQDELLQDILARGADHPGFRDSVAITDRLFGRIAARMGASPIVVFETCTTAAPFHPAVAEIAKKHGMEFVPDLPGALDVAQQAGQVLLAGDHVHWNEEAHRIIADVLAPRLRRILASHPDRPTDLGAPRS